MYSGRWEHQTPVAPRIVGFLPAGCTYRDRASRLSRARIPTPGRIIVAGGASDAEGEARLGGLAGVSRFEL